MSPVGRVVPLVDDIFTVKQEKAMVAFASILLLVGVLGVALCIYAMFAWREYSFLAGYCAFGCILLVVAGNLVIDNGLDPSEVPWPLAKAHEYLSPVVIGIALIVLGVLMLIAASFAHAAGHRVTALGITTDENAPAQDRWMWSLILLGVVAIIAGLVTLSTTLKWFQPETYKSLVRAANVHDRRSGKQHYKASMSPNFRITLEPEDVDVKDAESWLDDVNKAMKLDGSDVEAKKFVRVVVETIDRATMDMQVHFESNKTRKDPKDAKKDVTVIMSYPIQDKTLGKAGMEKWAKERLRHINKMLPDLPQTAAYPEAGASVETESTTYPASKVPGIPKLKVVN